jgi:hypothetical protein
MVPNIFFQLSPVITISCLLNILNSEINQPHQGKQMCSDTMFLLLAHQTILHICVPKMYFMKSATVDQPILSQFPKSKSNCEMVTSCKFTRPCSQLGTFESIQHNAMVLVVKGSLSCIPIMKVAGALLGIDSGIGLQLVRLTIHISANFKSV